ncbi:MAG TPA: histidine kinase [Thermoleophilaceae bacterium]|nr:histidine kinase [Thermoleophilaceae bacterium]
MDIAVPAGRDLAGSRDPRWIGLTLCAVAAIGGSAAITAGGNGSNTELAAAGRALIVGIPLVAGLVTWKRREAGRFSAVLIATGAALFVSTLAESQDSLAYTVGRTAGWFTEVLLVYLILSYPTGRLPEAADRTLVGAMGAVVAILFLPRLFLAETFSVPSAYTGCTRGCPDNAFFLLSQEPAFVESFMRPAGTLFIIAVTAAVVLRLRQRMLDATPLARRMLTPVLALGVARCALVGLGFLTRDLDASAVWVEVTAWLLAFATPAIVIGFLIGLVRWRVFTGDALRHLGGTLHSAPDAASLRRSLAQAFDDPMIQIVFPAGDGTGGWVDSWGESLQTPRPGSGRSLTEVRSGEGVFAGAIHDEALTTSPDAIEAGIAMAAIAVENQRLTLEASVFRREQRESTARTAASVERERRRIERDLHDGAQQRLVALRIELELAADLVRTDPAECARALRRLEQEVDTTLEEVRMLAHGVYPPLLADIGLTEAVRAVAARTPLKVDVDSYDVGRYPPEVESAVYFCVLEAIQNVLKHAERARRVFVRLDGEYQAEIRFSVRDDGMGSPDAAILPGGGLTNMRDRATALGGDVQITTIPHVGTTVSGRVPTAPAA